MRRTARLLAPLVALVAFGLALVGVASAQESEPALVVRQVDAGADGSTSAQVLYSGPESDADGVTVTTNGQEASVDSVTPFGTGTTQGIGLVFEISGEMDDSGALTAAKEAVREWISAMPPGAGPRFSIVTASDSADVLLNYTASRERALAALDRVAPAPDEKGRENTALNTAVARAAQGLAEVDGPGTVIVMSAQGDTLGSGRAVASGALAAEDAVTIVLEYTGDGATTNLNSLISQHGGLVLETSSGDGMGELVEQAADITLNGQYTVTWSSDSEPGEVVDLTIQMGSASSEVSYLTGEVTAGKQALTLERTTQSGGIAFLQTGLGFWLAVLAVLIAAGGLAYVIVSLVVRDDQLSTVLDAYTEPRLAAAEDDEQGGSALAQTAILQRAVEITEQVASERGMLVRVEGLLERANLPLRAGEALFFYVSAVVIITILVLVLTANVVVGILLGGLAALLPIAVVNFLASQRKKKFMSQLPDTLQLLAGTLKAGYSLMQGVEAVSQEVDDPMGIELRRVVTESRLGRPLEEALEGTADRMASDDFSWAVMAIRIQREVGGNLSELLMTVAETMVARERLRRDVRTLTAEGRMSAIVLGGLPPGLGLVMYVLNPDYISTLFSDTLGNVMLVAAAISMGVGFMWMRKIINIEI